MLNVEDIKSLKKVFFIGIGGSSMSGIAMILKNFNIEVLGSNNCENNMTDKLINSNIKVYLFHDNKNITDDIDLVIYTSAINNDNVELIKAKSLGIPTLERSIFLGLLTRLYSNSIGVSGTHGKTSTTSMLSSVFLEAGLDPSIQVGSNLDLIKGNFRVGKSNHFIIEACEYKDSFLNFKLKSAIVLNIDSDHLDYFKNIDNIKKSFNRFVSKLDNDGFLIVNNDDNNSKELYKFTNAKTVSIGIQNKSDYMAKNIKFNELGYSSFEVFAYGKLLGNIDLNVYGEFNILNSLAVIALANESNISFDIIYKGLKNYSGVSRRLEYKGKFCEARVFDDYAHHPKEILAISDAIKNIKHNKCYVVFQPHTYTRVFNYYKEFAQALNLFDDIIITDIYAARETNIYNIDSSVIAQELYNKFSKEAKYYNLFEDIKTYLKNNVSKDDIIIIIGAGDINKLSEYLINN